ncbi:MAG TPA: DUF4124 domain-containing protein [Nevskiales bacterium]|nr:DUF4124 domain-containing protein [Nevskiales bacterium]
MRHVQTALGILLLCLGSTVAAELYKWVDKDGVVRYGDRIPPEYAKQQREVLNKEGDTIKVLEHEKTAQERAEEARQAELQRQAQEQAKRDMILLDMYGSEADLLKARDEQLSHMDGNIRIREISLQSAERDYTDRKQRADQLAQQGKPVPEDLQRQLQQLENSIASSKQALAKQQAERQALASRFERDILRWRELRAGVLPAPAGSAANQGANPGVGK